MNRNIFLLLIAAILSLALTACTASSTSTDPAPTPQVAANPSVSVEESTIVYQGDITADGVAEVASQYTEDITRLIITSRGGDMYAAMDLGSFVFDHALGVEVKDYAVSAAANYVATAAKTLYLHKDSVLGFQGGISVFGRDDEVLERDFFDKIGVESQITSLGTQENFAVQAKDKDGFTYTLGALAKLGLQDVSLLDGTWESPSNDMFDLFTIGRDEFYSTSYRAYESTPDAPPIEYSVTVEGSAILYDGELAYAGLEEIKDLYTDQIDRLVINSPGGEINIGMDFGDFIFEHKLDVEVRDLAFSSAANYVITAADTLYLHKEAVIGWHGGATQEVDNPEIEEGGEYYEYNQDSIKRETAFYEKIGVDQRITVYGQEEKFLEKAAEIGAFGWTYDVQTLHTMGLDDVQSIGEDWVPNTTLTFMGNSFPLLLIDE